MTSLNPPRILSAELGPIGTRNFLVFRPGEPGAVLIDCSDGVRDWVSPLLEEHGLRLEAVVLTHGHWDHISGYHELVAWWAEQGGATPPIYAHRSEEPFLKDPEAMRSFAIPGITLLPPNVDHWWEEGDLPGSYTLGGIDFEVRPVPGHSPGNVLLYQSDAGAAVVGDVIFKGSVGRTDLPLSDHPTLEKSILEQVYTLPDETVLMPGHGPDTTVKRERAVNPFVRG